MKKLILKILGLIIFLSIVSISSIAVINDTESSEQNSFTSGSIDLKIDSECNYLTCGCGNYLKGLICEPTCENQYCEGFGNWEETNLTKEKFFNFNNLEIGDSGENTISYHITNNDAYGSFSISTKTGEDCTNCERVITKSSVQSEEVSLSGLLSEEDKTIEEKEDLTLLGSPGGGNCATNAGYDSDCVEKLETWKESDISKTYTTTNGIISVVFIKAGKKCYRYTQDFVGYCYTISGIGTSTVTTSENMTSPFCKSISHTEYVVCQNPINYLKFFAWFDNGDNVFEPENGETTIFEPMLASEFFAEQTYILGDSQIGALEANSTNYIGFAWCAGEMNVDSQNGEITCEIPDNNCICDGSEDSKVCMDIQFYIEQARNNLNF